MEHNLQRSPGVPTCWKKGSLIGSGSFGNVYIGFDSQIGRFCAIKEAVISHCNESQSQESSVKQLRHEITMLSRLRHPNIVQYYGSESVKNSLYIYLEFAPGGSIQKLLHDYGAFKEPVIKNYTRQIVSGLAYLHSQQTVHRDIKGANVLIDSDGNVKLADFGMAKHVTAKSFARSLKGSPYWMAPEVSLLRETEEPKTETLCSPDPQEPLQGLRPLGRHLEPRLHGDRNGASPTALERSRTDSAALQAGHNPGNPPRPGFPLRPRQRLPPALPPEGPVPQGDCLAALLPSLVHFQSPPASLRARPCSSRECRLSLEQQQYQSADQQNALVAQQNGLVSHIRSYYYTIYTPHLYQSLRRRRAANLERLQLLLDRNVLVPELAQEILRRAQAQLIRLPLRRRLLQRPLHLRHLRHLFLQLPVLLLERRHSCKLLRAAAAALDDQELLLQRDQLGEQRRLPVDGLLAARAVLGPGE